MKTRATKRKQTSRRSGRTKASRTATNSRSGRTSERRNKSSRSRLRVNYGDADRIRTLLLSEDKDFLSSGDARALVTILNDVYPPRPQRPKQIFQPLLIGMGIGIILLAGMMAIV